MKKITKYPLITIAAICFCFYLYVRVGRYFFIEKDVRESMVGKIMNAPELPEQFYELYELTYPNSMNKGILSYLIERAVFSNYNSESPTLSTAYTFPIHGIKTYMLAFYLEDQTTHQQCLNFEADYIDFLHANVGIGTASQYYFKKGLVDLNDKEMLTLIIMMKNPSYYNPIRHLEKIEERVNSILERRENKKKSRNLMQLFNIL